MVCKSNTFLFIVPIILFACNKTDSQGIIGNTEIEIRDVITNLDTPWEIQWGPDNYIWLTERYGRVSRLNPETKSISPLITITGVHEESESGLLGMTFHPNFQDTPYVYLVYNYYDGKIKERIVRYIYSDEKLQTPIILLDNIAGSGNHDGSRLTVGPDKKLYITTGDAQNTSLAQDTNSLNGKILRMNLDGSIPGDNPYPDSYIWTTGHRNPQGLVFSSNGKLYSSEHGPNNDDEVNLIEKGRNYGWPDVHGFCNTVSEINFCGQNNVKEPLYAWTPTLAVAGIDIYTSNSIPEWKNCILMTSLKNKNLMSLKLNEDGTAITETDSWFNNDYGRLRDICISPDGRVFIATSNRDGRGDVSEGDDRIIEIKAKDPVLSNNKEIEPFNIKIYPNPVHGNLVIEMNSDFSQGNLQIFDNTGKVVYNDLISSKYEIKKGSLKPGFYILTIYNAVNFYKNYIVVSD